MMSDESWVGSESRRASLAVGAAREESAGGDERFVDTVAAMVGRHSTRERHSVERATEPT